MSCPGVPFAISLARGSVSRKAVGEKADDDDFDGVMAGGLIVQAQDTGRVLMIQRLPDKHDDDAAYARWEWPGGCLDVDDEGVWQGALREWEEETGSALGERSWLNAVMKTSWVKSLASSRSQRTRAQRL